MTDKKLQPLIILEGPDCSGKTTLLYELTRQLSGDWRTVHHGVYPKISQDQLPRFYVEPLFGLFEGGHQGVIMDRSWLSEPIYGDVFRQHNRMTNASRRHLERIALRHGAVVVLCLPSWEDVKFRWLERKGADSEAEYLDNVEQLKKVWLNYQTLPKMTDLPVVRYDYTKHSSQVNHLIKKIKDASTGVHEHWYRRTVGAWNAPVIIVGEKPSEVTNFDTIWQFPFCSFSPSGSSRWLTEHLESMAISERDLLWVNASDQLSFLNEIWNRPVICLGQAATDAYRRVCDREPAHAINHPQHQKRFRTTDPYGLGQLIEQYL